MAEEQEKPKQPESPSIPAFDPEKWDEGKRRAKLKMPHRQAEGADDHYFGID